MVELAAHSAVLCWLGIFPAVTTSFTATFLTLVSVAFHQNVVTYWLILGIRQVFHLRRQYREREKQALELELNSSELRSPLAPEGEDFFPGQAQKLCDALRCPKKLIRFTHEQGAGYHCEAGAPGLRDYSIYNWLAEALA